MVIVFKKKNYYGARSTARLKRKKTTAIVVSICAIQGVLVHELYTYPFAYHGQDAWRKLQPRYLGIHLRSAP